MTIYNIESVCSILMMFSVFGISPIVDIIGRRNGIMRSFMTCIFCKILLGPSNQGG
jgi:hypothetical protein